jgi:hypothetical protein
VFTASLLALSSIVRVSSRVWWHTRLSPFEPRDLQLIGGPVGDNNPDGAAGMSRLKFMGIAAAGAAAAIAAITLRSGVPGLKSGKPKTIVSSLPGEGSIFQPKNPPRG